MEYFLGNGRDLDVIIKLIWWVCTGKLAPIENGGLESEVGNLGGEICCGGVIIQRGHFRVFSFFNVDFSWYVGPKSRVKHVTNNYI